MDALRIDTQEYEPMLEQAVTTGIRLALHTRLRDPILQGVEREFDQIAVPSQEQDAGSHAGNSRRMMAMQGLVVFVVMFAGLYLLLRKLTNDGE